MLSSRIVWTRHEARQLLAPGAADAAAGLDIDRAPALRARDPHARTAALSGSNDGPSRQSARALHRRRPSEPGGLLDRTQEMAERSRPPPANRTALATPHRHHEAVELS